MSYINAFEVLPKDLVDQIQNYIDGEVIYIPRQEKNRKLWGENTDTKEKLSIRNEKIYEDYKKGMSIKQLSHKFFLVEKSIQRIVNQECNKK